MKPRNLWYAALITLGLSLQACDNNDDIAGVIETPTNTNETISQVSNSIAHQWTDLYLELERYSAGRPNASARAIAYVYLAAYETMVPGMANYNSLDNRFRGLRLRDDQRADNISYQVALNTAFSTVLNHFLYNVPDAQMNQIEALSSTIDAQLINQVDNTIIEDSQAWGRYVAERVIAFSQTDDEAEEQILDPQPLSYEPETGDGYWTYSADPERALYPYWGETARTFVISPDETTSVDPIAYSTDPNSAYYQEMLEVYNENNDARDADSEQLWIAEFWSDDVEGMMMSPPARQVSIANQLIEQFDMSLEESIVMLLKLGFSLNDAAVTAWKYKYDYMVMRPNVYIHEFIDADFQTNFYRLVFWPNPSFPGYPSGHSTFASAAAGVYINAFAIRSISPIRRMRGEPNLEEHQEPLPVLPKWPMKMHSLESR